MISGEDLNTARKTTKERKPAKPEWIWDVLIVGVLLIGALFRFTGLNWDANYHLHPDERFLTMVEDAITPVESLANYFDTGHSTLNPNNRGYTFYVYGTLPIFIVRYIGEWVGMTGYSKIHLVGRAVSGVFDLGTILFIFLIGRKLYKNSKLGLLAALFSALAVLQIQLSHYFTVDILANFFAYAAIYTAICIMMAEPSREGIDSLKDGVINWQRLLKTRGDIAKYLIFAVLFGLALASKVSLYALALLLPLSALVFMMKQPGEYRYVNLLVILRNLAIAAIVAFITFRIFQPYAFIGPGFFGLKINQAWINSLKELSVISKGDVDVPYALQWARRPLSFAVNNLVQWGLGISLGILGCFSFLWMGWRILKGDWHKHIVLWGWTAFILLTQSLNWVRSMRYLLPLYPAFCLIAAWGIFKLWENGAGAVRKITQISFNWRRILAVLAALITMAGTAFWAIAFTSIYTRPVTRVAASDWIYRNISSAIELPIAGGDGAVTQQLLSYQNTSLIAANQTYQYGFIADLDGTLQTFTLEHVQYSVQAESAPEIPETISLLVTLKEGTADSPTMLASGILQSNFLQAGDPRGEKAIIVFDPEVSLVKGRHYLLEIQVVEADIYLKLDGGAWLTTSAGGSDRRQYLPPPAYRITADSPFNVNFIPQVSGTLSSLRLNRIVDQLSSDQPKTLTASIINPVQPDQVIAQGSVTSVFQAVGDIRGEEVEIVLGDPVALDADVMYVLRLEILGGEGALAVYNNVPVIESTWDDALPLSMHGYNLFGYETGLFGNIRNMELYYDDSPTKKDSLFTNLDLSDSIFITSSRQWGSIVRVPERYPLTTAYYRALIGCPADKDILWCYQVAEPGMFTGQLGFTLTAIFQSNPTFAGLEINDQSAEEAFTVYDHPKVLVFTKTANYSPEKMRAVLDDVDITTAVHKTPGQASRFSSNLLLSEENEAIQQSGGTWAELFPADSPLNLYPGLATLVWYLVITLLGWMVYPIVRTLFGGLPDKGYPLSRLVGMILMAYFTWLAGSTLFTFSRTTILCVLAGILVTSVILAVSQRKELLTEIKTRKRYFLTVELAMLVLFLVSLGIRYGNPDLWHPWRGGEKPMDLSYFTAVLKSTVFPPYDPWYAGGTINYYYYGFVLTGVPAKLLGIVPGIAYNLILPTLFALSGLGAFSIGWNIFARIQSTEDAQAAETRANNLRSTYAGVTSVLLVLILGNLGTLRMIWQGLQRLAAPGGSIEQANLFMRLSWFFQGLGKFLSGLHLPFGFGDWYWIPSRALPGDTISEFPLFTFTYADLHAHMIALPLTILVIGWALGILLGKWEWKGKVEAHKWVRITATFVFGGLLIGMLKATNTWDYPTYLLLSCLVVLYTFWRYGTPPQGFFPQRSLWFRKMLITFGILGCVVISAMIFFLPFSQNYGQAYGSIQLWTGDRSPLSSYLVHWGIPLFILTSWFIWETREWLAATPVSALKKLRPYTGLLQALVILFILLLLLLTLLHVKIGWLAGLLGGWALLLILRKDQSDVKRMVLFMTGTGLVLTLFVEMFVLLGDIGRMNTVFKFYYQAWTLFGLSSAAALMWLIPVVANRWKPVSSAVWQIVLAVLIFGAALYPVTAITDKIRDRMSTETPHTLNGLEFMKTSHYFDQGIDLDLNQDYLGIQWMQQNVKGSPVIVEANTVEYRWGNRYTIYTGLPGVLGWNWHQRQQRGFVDYNGIANRLNEIMDFYNLTDVLSALTFIKTYNVKFIIVGQMERAYYTPEGLDKFIQYDGVYWTEVFRYQDTVIYQVIEQ